ncbi:hypothetical protein N7448_008042 [Penicillium atrosanguineum]|uniref:uncharacterized protein n=1 Tax=Penicillium atrosanguineum TaxID=1132637 RepID=UPI0023A45490|nr:uncharacterized protein N7443_000939 [Penicillium atrosanguineum]KAJ5127263.1 hypothetical protein N7448_008042 [Penicillium atrosanguineum]KAJ5314055.1 hypothetical protein N7443_000939 [Penicillium atrosanguineum]
MSQSNYLAVVPPPPTFDPATYKPFDDEYDRTIERILTEDASFECKDDHFPIYPGRRSSTETSNRHAPQNDSKVEGSRFLTRSQSPGGKKVRTTPRRAAQRDITVIHLDTDNEGDVDIDALLEVESAKLAAKEGLTKNNLIDLPYRDLDSANDPWVGSQEVGNSKDVNISDQGDNEENKNVDDPCESPGSLNDSNSIGKEASLHDTDYNHNGSHPLRSSHGDVNILNESNLNRDETRLGDDKNNIKGNSDTSKEENDTKKDRNDDNYISEAFHADVDFLADARSSSGGIFEIPTKNEVFDLVAGKEIAAEKVRAEEDIIFACMEPSRRQEFFQSVLAHPFMQNLEVPVRQSARRQFVKDMRREAASVGMDAVDIDTFIVYMRRVFMESIIGVPADTTGDVRNLKFGEEINDEYKSRKRYLSNPEQAGSCKRRKSKVNRRASVEASVSSLQSTPQPSSETKNVSQPKVEQTAQSIAKKDSCGSLCKDKNVASVPKTPEYVLCEQDPAQGFGNMQMVFQQDMEIPNHPNEAEKLDAKKSKSKVTQPDNDSAAVGEALNGNNPLRKGHVGCASPKTSLGSVQESQPSEPELPPIFERATRLLKFKRHKEPPKQPTEKIDSGNAVEQSAVDNVMVDMTRSSHSPETTVPSELPEKQMSAIANPEESQYAQDHPEKSQHSNNDVEKATCQPSNADSGQAGPTSELSLQGKKAKNYRKKEKKRQKKRESYLHIQNTSNADQQRAERQRTPVHSESTAVAATPPSRTSNRSTDLMRHGPLSPNPAEWSVDF